jgi:hypothetical protein
LAKAKVREWSALRDTAHLRVMFGAPVWLEGGIAPMVGELPNRWALYAGFGELAMVGIMGLYGVVG